MIDPPPRPLTTPIEDRCRTESTAPQGRWIAVLVVVAAAAGVAVIVAGVALGGAWRWAAGAATVALIAAIAVPSLAERPRGGRR